MIPLVSGGAKSTFRVGIQIVVHETGRSNGSETSVAQCLCLCWVLRSCDVHILVQSRILTSKTSLNAKTILAMGRMNPTTRRWGRRGWRNVEIVAYCLLYCFSIWSIRTVRHTKSPPTCSDISRKPSGDEDVQADERGERVVAAPKLMDPLQENLGYDGVLSGLRET